MPKKKFDYALTTTSRSRRPFDAVDAGTDGLTVAEPSLAAQKGR